MAINFITGYPLIIQNTTGTSVIASGAINQSGMIYSVIVPAASGIPSAQQIYDGQNSASGTLAVNLRSSGLATASGVEVRLSGFNLTSETSYVMYVTASGGVDGLYASGEPLAFVTPDITAPAWSGSYPSLVTAYGTSGTFALAVNSASCSGWVFVSASGAPVPAAADIVTSGTIVGMPAANTVYNVTVTGLVSETNYTAYAIARDTSLNLMSSGNPVSFTTSDITAPAWTAGYPTVTAITTSTATVTLNMNDAGSGFFVIIPASGGAPSRAQIMAATDSGDNAVPQGLYGSSALTLSTNATVAATNLRYGTYYTAYFAGKDESENQIATVATFGFRTLVPPVGVSGPYSLKNIQKRRKQREENMRRALFN